MSTTRVRINYGRRTWIENKHISITRNGDKIEGKGRDKDCIKTNHYCGEVWDKA